ATSGWIYQLDLQTGQIRDLATNLCCGLNNPNPVLAPDGSSVVYVDYHSQVAWPSYGPKDPCDLRCGTLWSLDPTTGTRRQITVEPDGGSDIRPVFSPDGS